MAEGEDESQRAKGKFKVFDIAFSVPVREDDPSYDSVLPWFTRWMETFQEQHGRGLMIGSVRHRIIITVFEPFYHLIEGQMRWLDDQAEVSGVESKFRWI